MNSMRFEIVRQADPLNRQVWSFYLSDDLVLYVDTYAVQSRSSSRHKFKDVKAYNRLERKDFVSNWSIEEKDVPLPEDVKSEVAADLSARVRVAKWKDRVHL